MTPKRGNRHAKRSGRPLKIDAVCPCCGEPLSLKHGCACDDAERRGLPIPQPGDLDSPGIINIYRMTLRHYGITKGAG